MTQPPLQEGLLSKVPPNSLDAEQSLLSACIISPESLIEAIEILQPSHFYKNAHQKIFQAMTDLHAKNEPVDLVTLSNRLKQKYQLDEIGGATYLASLVDEVPIALNVPNYANIIRDKAVLRLTIQKSSNIISKCYEDSDDASAIVDTAQKEILSIEVEDPDDKTYSTMGEIAENVFDVLDERSKNPGQITGIPTGFMQLDMLTWGLQPSDLVVIAARPSMGKTAIALNIARHAAVERNMPVAIFSMEMSEQQLAFRVLSNEAKINSQKFKSGMFSPEEWQRLTNAASKISDAPIYIDDSSGLHINQVLRRSRRLWKKHGIKMVIVDYIQLMKGDKDNGSRDREIASITGGLKGLAKELNIPVVGLSQLNRDLEKRSNKRPQMADLRESGSIENDADVIAFIYRDEVYNKDEDNPEKGMAEIIIAKQRNGPIGTIKLSFVDRYASFYPLDNLHEGRQ